MIGFAVSFLTWTAATLFPALGGLLTITRANKLVEARYLVAFAFGIFLWFFVDTIGGAAGLDVNSGFSGGAAQVGLLILFITGLLFFFWIDRKRNVFSPMSAIGKYGIAIPILVALAVGIHGLGEGEAFGGTAYSTTSTTLLDAFGGLGAGIAYVLHKGLEPMMIGASYTVFVEARARNATGWIKDMAILAVIFAIPSVIGAAIGYFIAFEATYLFALGTGTSIYAGIRLAGPMIIVNGNQNPRESIKFAGSLMLGVIAIYLAALFHAG